MVNRDKRAVARRILEGFVRGTVTNRGMDEEFPIDRDDPALAAIWERVWFFWDDFHTHTFTDDGKSGEERHAIIERCLAFLGSDLEYEWPKLKRGSFAALFLGLSGLGRKSGENQSKDRQYIESCGDFNVWPFNREEDWLRCKK